MFPRIFTGIRNSINNPGSMQRPTQRLTLEDSSEEFVRATKPIQILSTRIPVSAAAFGLSYNEADDFIQKDLISTSWI
ncbi:hypothetical protein INT47_003462 [Mucor saturninus]|uniref:Uncharacterized protein n=1 Tax=Mucor saturninus TaxID=64648 RepID=A0A8H7RF52_9FUNG|nr:hypothetical protein INT47_003462 [Mucor saturninus]